MARTLDDVMADAKAYAATLPGGKVTCKKFNYGADIIISWDEPDVRIEVNFLDQYGESWTQYRNGHIPNTYYTEEY